MTDAGPPEDALLLASTAPGEESTEDDRGFPSVLYVVVAHGASPGLDETLRSLAGQDYPELDVLVVASESAGDPTERVRAVLPDASVRRTGTPGFAAAANVASEVMRDDVSFLCFGRDDVSLDANAVRLLVAEAYRSNAAICGPKLVEHDHPEVLLEVGRSIDRFGGTHTEIEPGELDQGQHDAVRDVFYVPRDAMLVRADLFTALDGFDPDAVPGSEDLDLCWRARLAEARVIVVPDARVRRRSTRDARTDTASVRELARRRVRTAFVCYSMLSLVWIVPIGLVSTAIEALVFLFTRRRREALAEAGAWWWNLAHAGRNKGARRRAQRHRTVHDIDLFELQLGWRARLRSFLAHRHADERMESIADRLRAGLEASGTLFHHPGVVAFGGFVLLVLLGSREILTDGVAGVGTLLPWTDARAMFEAFGSGWRATGLGAAEPASGALGVIGALTALTLDHPGLAQTGLVVGALVVGPVGVARLVRRLGAGLGSAMTAAILYGVNPVGRNAVANGRLGPIVLFALAPFVVLLFVRAAGFPGLTKGGRRWRALLGLAVLSAVITAFYPPGALFVGLVLVATLVGSMCTGRGVVASLRGVVVAVAGTVLAAALLLPWSLTFLDFRDDPGAFGFAFWLPDRSLDAVLRFQTGPAGAGIGSWGLYAAASFALVVASGSRLSWVARAWCLTGLGVAAVFVPSQLWPDVGVPAPEGPLVAAALGLAVAAGLGIDAFGDELRRARFGWRHLAALLAGAGAVVAALGFVGDAVGGRWHSANVGWDDEIAFVRDQRFAGGFRILWIGDPSVLPTDPFEQRDGVGYALTNDGAGDAREILRAARTGADDALKASVDLALDGRTNRLGRLVAPFGVRYIAAPTRNGPDGVDAQRVRGLAARLSDQLDLAQLRVEAGLLFYENTAWIPSRSIVPRDVDVPSGDVDPVGAALRTDLEGEAVPLGDGRVGPGEVLLAEAFDERWVATSGSRSLTHTRAFGWSNGYRLPGRGSVDLHFEGQGSVNLMVAGQVAGWLLVALVLWRGRHRGRRVGSEES